jgi:hypothetical protein
MEIIRHILVLASLLALSLQPVLAMPEPTPAPELVSLDKRDCSADNCLRAVRRNALSAIPFCSTYTTEVTATIPTWAANCANNPTRVTSACNCLAVRTANSKVLPVKKERWQNHDFGRRHLWPRSMGRPTTPTTPSGSKPTTLEAGLRHGKSP